MSDVMIHELNTADSLGGTEWIPVDNGTDTRKTNLMSFIAGIIDPTLTISGKAADAKATGDAITAERTARTAQTANINSILKDDMIGVSQAIYYTALKRGAAEQETGPLVPFKIVPGETYTAKTADGATFGNVHLRFYDEDKNLITYIALREGFGNERTVVYSGGDNAKTAYYAGIITVDASSPEDYIVINHNNPYIESINSKLNEIDNELEFKLDSDIINVVNRFNKETITPNSYLSTSSGNTLSGSGFFCSDYIYVYDLVSVSCSKTHIVCFYDENKAYIPGTGQTFNTRNADGSIARPETAYYMRFSTYNAELDSAQIGESVSRTNYESYGRFTMPDFISGNAEKIIVDKNGGGNYTSLTKCLFDNVDSKADIEVKPGTYDLVSEYVTLFGQSAVDSMADADNDTFKGFQYGIIIRNKTITFDSGAHIVCDWTGHLVNGTHRFSAVRVDYNCKIIGLNLVSTGTFYAIHDDYGTNSNPYTVEYENCYIEGVNLRNANCIGGGCKKSSRHFIRNCYFDNHLTDSATVRYHNTNAEGAEPEIYVSNCYFNNWFTPRWYGSQTSKMKVYVNNCEARSIYKMAESSSFNVDNVELYKWCNTETSPV